jgi:hypothetical protein
MSLPQASDLRALGFGDDGAPFDLQAPASGVTTVDLGWGSDGEPIGYAPASATPGVIALSGNKATGRVGTATVASGSVTRALTGNKATGSVGTATATGSGSTTVALSGNKATGRVGTAGVTNSSVTRALTGNKATGVRGSVGVSKSATLALSGNKATGKVGTAAALSGVIYRASTWSRNNGTSVSLPLPAGVAPGDVVLVLATTNSASGTVTPPSGWTTLSARIGYALFYRTFQSGDPTTIAIASSDSARIDAASAAYYNVDQLTPIDGWSEGHIYSDGVSAYDISNVKWPLRAPAVMPYYGSGRCVAMFSTTAYPAGQNAGAWTVPSGFTQRVYDAGVGPSTWIGDKTLTGNANTGNAELITAAGEDNTTPNWHHGFQVVLKVAGGVALTQGTPAVAQAGNASAVVNEGDINAPTQGVLSITGALSKIYPYPGDMVLVSLLGGTPSGLPSGYSLVQSGTLGNIYAKIYANGDPDPTFTFASLTVTAAHVALYRAVGSINLQIDNAAGHETLTYPQTTNHPLPAMTPTMTGSSIEALHAAWFTNNPNTFSLGAFNDAGADFTQSNGSYQVGFQTNITSAVASYTSLSTANCPSTEIAVLIGGVPSGSATVRVGGAKGVGRVGTPAAVVTKALTGVKGTARVGSVGVTQVSKNVALTGTVATGRVGSPAYQSTTALSAAAATGRVGAAISTRNTQLAGVGGTARVGNTLSQLTVSPTGNQAGTQAGGIDSTGRTVAAPGVQAAGRVAPVSVNRSVDTARVHASGRAGSVILTHNKVIQLDGNAATAAAGSVGAKRSLAVHGKTISCVPGTLVTGSVYRQDITGVDASGAAPGVVGTETTTSLTGVNAQAVAGVVQPTVARGITRVAATGKVHSISGFGLLGLVAGVRAGQLQASLALPLSGVGARARAGLLRSHAALHGGPSAFASTSVSEALAVSGLQQVVVLSRDDSAFAVVSEETTLVVP